MFGSSSVPARASSSMSNPNQVLDSHLEPHWMVEQVDLDQELKGHEFGEDAAIFGFFKKEIAFNNNVLERLTQAGKEGNVEAIQSILEDLFYLFNFTSNEDDVQFIRNLFDQAGALLDNISDEGKRESFSFLREIVDRGKQYTVSAHHSPTMMDRYRIAFDVYIKSFSEGLTNRERFAKFQVLFQEVLLRDAFVLMGPPPCTYDMRTIGPLGRQEICPYFGFKWFILIASDNEADRSYFVRLGRLIQTQMTSMTGATTTSLDTPSNPFNRRHVISLKVLPSLTFTNEVLQKNALKEMLSGSASLATNDYTLHERHQKMLDELLNQPHCMESVQSEREFRASQWIEENSKQYLKIWSRPFAEQTIDLNLHFVQLIHDLINNLAIYHGAILNHPEEVVDQLVEKECFIPETAHLIKETMRFIDELRMRLHFHYRQDQDELEITATQPNAFPLTKRDKESLTRAYWFILKPLYSHLAKKENPPFNQFSIIDSMVETFSPVENSLLNHAEIQDLTQQLVTYLCKRESAMELHQKLYQKLSNSLVLEPIRTFYLNTLNAHGFHDIANTLAFHPNRGGVRQSTRLDETDFQTALHSLVQSTPPVAPLVCKVTSPSLNGTHYLKSTVPIFSPDGNILKQDRSSKHRECSYHDVEGMHFSFRQKPSHPLMEYIIYNLFSRLMGRGVPRSELARFEVFSNDNHLTTYPVLISELVEGINLDTVLDDPDVIQQIDRKHFTWMCLATLLTRPGSNVASHYTLKPNGEIYSTRNEVCFVEPLAKEFKGLKTQLCSILFCLQTPLDQNVLQEFCALDVSSILESLIEDVVNRQNEWCSLFSPQERQRLYEEDPNNRFTSTLLIRESELATLCVQFHYLQECIQQARPALALDLLNYLITLRGGLVGPHIHKAYEKGRGMAPKAQLRQALNRTNDMFLKPSKADKISFGRTPTFEEIERQTFSIHLAQEELQTYSILYDKGISRISEGIVEVDFSYCRNNSEKEQEMINVLLLHLAHQPKKLKSLTLMRSTILTEKQIKPFLSEELTTLDLHGCTKLSSVSSIVARCPHLEKINLNGCIGLKAFVQLDPKGKKGFAHLPYLQELHIERCPKLKIILLQSYALKELRANNNPNLMTLDLMVPIMPEIDVLECPKIPYRLMNQIEKRVANHRNPWDLSRKSVHQLFDTNCRELTLSSVLALTKIQELLKRKPSLDYVRLCYPHTPDIVLQAAKFVLKKYPSIISLNLRLNQLGDLRIEWLAKELELGSSLQRLSLEGNMMTDIGGRALVGIVNKTQLIRIDLGDEKDGDQIGENTRQEIENLTANQRAKFEFDRRTIAAGSSTTHLMGEGTERLAILEQQIEALESLKTTGILDWNTVEELIRELQELPIGWTQARELLQRAKMLQGNCPSSSFSAN